MQTVTLSVMALLYNNKTCSLLKIREELNQIVHWYFLGFKSPITIRDAQENKGKHASATSNQATTETHDPITSYNNEQRQPFAPRHKGMYSNE